jgi:hypothetical protein
VLAKESLPGWQSTCEKTKHALLPTHLRAYPIHTYIIIIISDIANMRMKGGRRVSKYLCFRIKHG